MDFLVLEYLEGRSLAEALRRGPLPVSDAIRIAIGITTALEAAHHAGVFHRDLKPGNVMLVKSGPKLVDFGLARLAQPSVTGADATTVAQRATASGQILGTLQYMAPEQLESREGDARTDIFACGCVLYEMLIGSPAFPGDSAANVIAAIMGSEPKALAAPDDAIPFGLKKILRSCLAKDPNERFQTARDLRRALEWSFEEAPPAAPARRNLLPWLVAAACLLVALGAIARHGGGTATATKPAAIRFHFSEPEGAWLQRFITQQGLAISLSGGRVAMIARDANGPRIWIRKSDSVKAVALPGTEGALSLFWSPDSKYIGFFADGKLKKIPAAGGGAVPICDLPPIWSATWSAQGDIVATLNRTRSLRIRADTGTVLGAGAHSVAAFPAGWQEADLRQTRRRHSLRVSGGFCLRPRFAFNGRRHASDLRSLPRWLEGWIYRLWARLDTARAAIRSRPAECGE